MSSPSPATPLKAPALSGLLLWVFVLSGFAGLLYQSIWAHYLGLLLGHAAYAQVLVLTLFMGGMALGAWLVSHFTASLRRPLLLYAAIELLLGLVGLAFHAYYSTLSGWAYNTLFPLLSSGLPLETARWGLAATLILPQCLLLGATFPLMSAGYIRWRPQASGRVLAGLYFTNSLGAAAGALAATYGFLPAWGLPGTVMAAGVLNLYVAALVWPLARLQQPQPAPQQAADTHGEKASMRLVLWAAGLTGATSFVYEVVWVRMLSMVLGSTLHSFELMLAAFIFGIACGGWWLSKRADALPSAKKAAGWAQMAKGVAALATLFLYNASFHWAGWMMGGLHREADAAYTLYNVASALISMALMLPSAFFAGMTLPLFTLSLLRQNVGEKAIGRVYAVNTLGAIVGVILGIYCLIPWLGLRLSLWSAASVDVVLGLVLLGAVWRKQASPFRKTAWASVGVAGLLLFSVLASRFDLELMSSGVFRHGVLKMPGQVAIYHEDGRTSSVAILKTADTLSLTTNGKPDASIGMEDEVAIDEMTMVSAAVLPMLYKPVAPTVGIVGFGSGMTTHYVLGNPEVGEVHTIEIEPAMVRAARHFGDRVARAYEDSRSHIVIDDAKSYFSTNRKKYNMVISEPSNPWVSGVAALFSKEFYAFVPRHLSEDGLFVQWIQLYEMGPELVASIAKALLPYFVDIHLFQGNNTDLIVLASPRQPLSRVGALAFPASWPQAFREEMAHRGLREEADIGTLYLGNKEVLEAFVALFPEVPANSDYFPLLQLEAPKARFKGQGTYFFAELKNAPWPVLEVLTGVETPPLAYEGLREKLSSDYLSNRARAKELRRRLLGEGAGVAAKLELLESLSAERLKSMGKSCDFQEEGLGLLAQVARHSIPFLRPEDLEGLWLRPQWLLCHPEDEAVREYLAFLAALAGRQHEGALLHGEAFLQSQGLYGDSEAVGHALGGTQLAAFALGDMEKVAQLESLYAGNAVASEARLLLVQAARNRRGLLPPAQ